MNNKQISVNLIGSIVACLTMLAVSFFLTPYLVEALGDEAYGYIGMANNIVSYACIFTTALNSMAARFVIIARAKGQTALVNEYYSSLFYAGAALAGAFVLVGAALALNAERLFRITPSLVPAVRITFALSSLNYVLVALLSVFSVSAFAVNRLEETAKVEIVGNVLKAAFLVAVFTLLPPQIYYVSIGGVLYTLVVYLLHIRNTRRLLPDVRITRRAVRFGTIKTLVGSGIWNSMTHVIYLLMVGMDLVLANWLLDGKAMGLLSVSMTIALAMNSILTAVINAFKPSLTRLYAEGDYAALRPAVLRTDRIQTLLMAVPIAGLMLFGRRFYQLWLPYKSADEVAVLAAITSFKVLEQFANVSTEAFQFNFTMYNRLKTPMLTKLLFSLCNIPLVILLVKLTDNWKTGVYLVAGLSTVLFMAYYYGVVPRLSARVTGEKTGAYYRCLGGLVALFLLLVGMFFAIDRLAPQTGWAGFTLLVCCAGALGYAAMFALGATRSEKRLLLEKLRRLVGKGNGNGKGESGNGKEA